MFLYSRKCIDIYQIPDIVGHCGIVEGVGETGFIYVSKLPVMELA